MGHTSTLDWSPALSPLCSTDQTADPKVSTDPNPIEIEIDQLTCGIDRELIETPTLAAPSTISQLGS